MAESVIYVVLIKAVKDCWVDKKIVHSYSQLIRTLKERLGVCQVLASPTCECVQYAGLMTDSLHPKISLLDFLHPEPGEDFMSGLPSTLQHIDLEVIEQSASTPSNIPGLLASLRDKNSIIFIEDSHINSIESISELRKDTECLSIYRILNTENLLVLIKSYEIRENCLRLYLENVKFSKKSLNILVKETGEVIAIIKSFQGNIRIDLHRIDLNQEKIKKSTESVRHLLTQSNLDFFNTHLVAVSSGVKISNELYVSEYKLDVALIKNYYFCRIRNLSKNKYEFIQLACGEFVKLVDCTEMPIQATILIKIKQRKLKPPFTFLLKYKGSVISNIFRFCEDSLENF